MFHVTLAGYPFTIENQFAYVEQLCRDYQTDVPGEKIFLEKKEILREQTDDKAWPMGYLESLAVYRKICESLIFRDVVLFHCSALKLDGKGYLFTAPSGTGKSTHARLWRKHFGNKVTMINDDKPLLHIDAGKITVYGTPFAGKEGLQENTSAPVQGIVILHQAKENHIRRLSVQEAYPMLLSQTYRTSDLNGLRRTLELVQQLAELPVYALGCTISKEAVELAFDALVRQEE